MLEPNPDGQYLTKRLNSSYFAFFLMNKTVLEKGKINTLCTDNTTSWGQDKSVKPMNSGNKNVCITLF